MAAELECGIFLSDYAIEATVPRKPKPTDAETIENLKRDLALQHELRGLALSDLIQASRDRDILARRCREQSKQLYTVLQQPALSAEAAVAAIMARADEDGALHRDAMIDVLRQMGAR